MGISLSPFQPGQVVQDPNQQDALTALMKAFAQGSELGVRGLEEAGRNSRSSAENELQKARLMLDGKKLDLEMADKKIALERAKAEGEALKQWLPHAIATGQMAPPQQQAQQPQPVPQGAPQGVPQAAPLSPMQGLEAVVSQMAPEYRMGFSDKVRPYAEEAQKAYEAARAEEAAVAERKRIVTNAVAGMPEAVREKAGRMLELGFLKLDKNIADPLIQELWGPTWTSEEVNSLVGFATKMSSATGTPIPLGKLGALFGKQVPAELRDAQFVAPKEEWRPTVQQNVASAQFKVMGGAYKFLQEASQIGNPGAIASLLKNVKAGSFGEAVLNQVLPDQLFSKADKEYLQSLRVFVDSYVRVVSGAQVNADEFARFMLSLGEGAGDPPEVRQRKSRARTAIMGAIYDISQQKIAGTQSLDNLLASGDLGTLSAEDRAVFQKLRDDALLYERTGVTRNDFSARNTEPLTADRLSNISRQIQVTP